MSWLEFYCAGYSPSKSSGVALQILHFLAAQGSINRETRMIVNFCADFCFLTLNVEQYRVQNLCLCVFLDLHWSSRLFEPVAKIICS